MTMTNRQRDERLMEALRLREDGKSMAEIARRLGFASAAAIGVAIGTIRRDTDRSDAHSASGQAGGVESIKSATRMPLGRDGHSAALSAPLKVR